MLLFFNLFFSVFLRRPRGAGARAHLGKIGFRVEGIAFLASRPLARNEKIEKMIRRAVQNRLENSTKNACSQTCEKPSKIIPKSPKMPPKNDPGGLRRPLASQVRARSLPKLLPEASGISKFGIFRVPERFFQIFINFEARGGSVRPTVACPFPPRPPL